MSQIRAFILAAGQGTRLAPLTETLPKPLIPVFHKPLITFAIDHLLSLGITEIGINTRHLWKAFYDEFKVVPAANGSARGFYQGHPLEFFKEDTHLDTGGGLRNALPFLDKKPFLLHNGDILTNIPLKELLEHHQQSGAIATLLLREGGGTRDVCFDRTSNRVLDIRGGSPLQTPCDYCLYTGIAVVEPTLLDFMAPEGPVSLIDALLDARDAGHHVSGFLKTSGFWSDLGTPSSYLQAHISIAEHGIHFPYIKKEPSAPWPAAIHPTATVSPLARLEGTVVVGPHVSIAAGARLTNCVLHPGAIITAHSQLSEVIVRSGTSVSGCHHQTIL